MTAVSAYKLELICYYCHYYYYNYHYNISTYLITGHILST